MAMADRIAVMEGGSVLQLAAPQALYDDPQSLAVARFVGTPPINIWPIDITARGALIMSGIHLPFHAGSLSGPALLGIRPEALELNRHGLQARLLRMEKLGMETLVHCQVAGVPDLTILRLPPATAERLSGQDSIHILPRRAILFDRDGARRPLYEAESVHA
jgi:multiple sugar transport system ATP-binding protein